MLQRSLMFSQIAVMVLASATAASSERGRDGLLSVSMWQEPTTLNTYLSNGFKDMAASGIILEPLASLDPSGQWEPRLATQIPTVENGGIAPDYSSITWQLQAGLVWSDGSPLTAEDVRFTWQYCIHENINCARRNRFSNVAEVEVTDTHTLTIHFESPEFEPYSVFAEYQMPILQKAQFARCLQANADCTAQNHAPIGTGPFRVTEFVAGSHISFVANNKYRIPSLPYFAALRIQPSDAAYDSALASLSDGTVDFAENLQVDPGVLLNFVSDHKGKILFSFAAGIERLHFNFSDPDPAHGEARATQTHPNPILSDRAVRQALTMALNREETVQIGYGWSGRVTCNLILVPEKYTSPNNDDCDQQDFDGARAILEEAGWVDRDGDGIREKDGRALRLVFQTSTNEVRQEFQDLAQIWWSEIGVATELKHFPPSTFFGGDITNDNTMEKFFADIELFMTTFSGVYPTEALDAYSCDNIPAPDNGWVGDNVGRYCNPEFETRLATLRRTADPEARRELIIEMNDLLIADYAFVPLVWRSNIHGYSMTLHDVQVNSFDSAFWGIERWRRAQ